MYTILALLSLVYAVAPAHVPVHEALVNFNGVCKCMLGYTALKYNGYGCWCGKGGSGTPVDGIDECCMHHDKCYDEALASGACSSTFWEYINLYNWACNEDTKTATCTDTTDACNLALCKCDTECVKCWSQYPKPDSKPKCPK
ncbi:unnamed protein product [Cylicocyclus nassatus]|uniref:Phospholipase A2 n=1 Tax=Cylicocyclus nassatus TaxID=53992 RepID=A0AA36H6U2_CYLNA|nr:unnamed protein product [Cylicocyclus nassatus]